MSDSPVIKLATPDPELETFVRASTQRVGSVGQERRVWNHIATPDAVRHFALGTSDENPLWFDSEKSDSGGGSVDLVPPAFILSVRYPVLHGAPVPVALENWIARAEIQWHQPMHHGDRLAGDSRLGEVSLVDVRSGEPPQVKLVTETNYRNQRDQSVADCSVQLFRAPATHGGLRIDRDCYRYDADELQAIQHAVLSEQRQGNQPFVMRQLEPGSQLPARVRGPLNIGDLVAWNAAIGPAAASGSWAWRDCLAAPHSTTTHPVTGALLKGSLQHEDVLLSGQRGMPLPFDNGMMRVAWLIPLITDWMGDQGQLQRLAVEILRPNLYGDTTWYSGYVSNRVATPRGVQLVLKLGGVNQLGEKTVRGEAAVAIPDSAIQRRPDVIRISSVSNQDDQKIDDEAFDLVANLRNYAKELPNREALTDHTGERLTYGQLQDKLELVAGWLQSRGVSAGDRVALVWPRDVYAAVFPLALWHVGATWIACEPDWPVNRLQAVFTDTDPRLIVVPADETPGLPEGVWPIARFQPDENGTPAVLPVADPGRAAYICYTSGSAGTATGVVVSRRSLNRYLRSLSQTFSVTSADRFAHTASFAFSASTRQMFLPLALGATLAIAGNPQRQDPRRLLEWLDRQEISVWDTVPAVWQAVIDVHSVGRSGQVAAPRQLQHIFLTGEPLRWQTVDTWRQQWSADQRIYNLYSQTETAGTAAVYEIPRGQIQTGDKFVPIGSPMPGISLTLIDEDKRPVADGETGRIVVTGNRLADGYLSTDAKGGGFARSPDGQQTSFTTGDLACLDEPGQLLIVGRADRRIKRRGFRIDLSEIESRLLQHPAISESAVALDNQSAHGQLLAHIAPDSLTAEKARQYLDQQLPAFMVPNQILIHKRLPRTASGKIAYRQLSAANVVDPAEPIAPRNATEHALLEIWNRIFERSDVRVTDNFFELGGDSLLVPRLLAEMEQQFGELVDSGAIYQHPRLEDFARVVSSSDGFNEVIKFRSGAHPAIFSFPLRSGDSVYVRHVLPHLTTDSGIYCLQPRMDDLMAGGCDDFQEAARRCVTAMRRAQPQGPYLLMGYSFAGMLAFEAACLLQQAGQTVAGLLLLDSATPQLYRLRRTFQYRTRRGMRIMRHLNDESLSGYWTRRLHRNWTSVSKRLRQIIGTQPATAAAPAIHQRNREFFTSALIRHQFSYLPLTVDLVQATRIRFLEIEPAANGWAELCDHVCCYPVDATHEGLLRPESAAAIADIMDQMAARAAGKISNRAA